MLSTTHTFIRKFMKDCDINTGKLLDVGSLDTNEVNNNLRGDLVEFDYIGIDMRPGKNVDIVMNAHDIRKNFEEELFDVVICMDTLEHDDKFWVTLENMKWVLKKGGWLVVGAPSLGHGIHRHPKDYWRFTEDSFKEVIFGDMEDVFVDVQYYQSKNPYMPDQVFGWGRRINDRL